MVRGPSPVQSHSPSLLPLGGGAPRGGWPPGRICLEAWQPLLSGRGGLPPRWQRRRRALHGHPRSAPSLSIRAELLPWTGSSSSGRRRRQGGHNQCILPVVVAAPLLCLGVSSPYRWQMEAAPRQPQHVLWVLSRRLGRSPSWVPWGCLRADCWDRVMQGRGQRAHPPKGRPPLIGKRRGELGAMLERNVHGSSSKALPAWPWAPRRHGPAIYLL